MALWNTIDAYHLETMMLNGPVLVHLVMLVPKTTMDHQCALKTNVKLKLLILNHTWPTDHSRLSSPSTHTGELTLFLRLIWNMLKSKQALSKQVDFKTDPVRNTVDSKQTHFEIVRIWKRTYLKKSQLKMSHFETGLFWSSLNSKQSEFETGPILNSPITKQAWFETPT